MTFFLSEPCVTHGVMYEYCGDARLSGVVVTGRWSLACTLFGSCAALRSGEAGEDACRLVSL